MKRLFSFFSILFVAGMTGFAVAQTNDVERDARHAYNAAWSGVDSLTRKQHYDDAYQLAQKRYERFCRSHNQRQMLVGAKILTDIAIQYRENAFDTALMRYAALLPQLDGVERTLGSLYVADLYSDYLLRNRWEINNLQPSDDLNAPYTEWHRQRLLDTIHAYIQQAFAKPDLLQATPAASLYPLAQHEGDKSCVNQTPTCHDVMVGKVQDIYWAIHSSTLNPFLFSDASLLLAPSEQFVAMPLPAVASGEAAIYCFLLRQMQEQEALSLRLGDETMMLKRYLQRCQFATSSVADLHSRLPQAYRTALNHFRHSQSPELAMLYTAFINTLSDTDYVVAQRYIDTVLHRFPGSHAASLCKNKRIDIEQPEVEIITMEDVVSANRHWVAYANCRNISRLYFRIVEAPKQTRGYYISDKKILQQRVLQKWHQDVPARDDYRIQGVYVPIDATALPVGKYLIICSNDSTFKSGICYHQFNVSSLMHLTTGNDKPNGFLLDRRSGHPVAGARVKLTGCNKYGEPYKTILESQTDSDGYYNFDSLLAGKGSQPPQYFDIEVEYKGEKMVLGSQTYRNNQHHMSLEGSFFTDRPIYRPGDTLHFSLLAYNEGTRLDAKQLLTGAEVRVRLYDGYARNRLLDSLSTSLDEYSSCNGVFVIPPDARPGSYLMEAQVIGKSVEKIGTITQYVRVEAYKQPKFMVSLHADSSARGFGKPVTVKGMAVAYSGVPLDGAEVTYSVEREEIAYRWWRPVSTPATVADGTATVGGEGQFAITFVPCPDSVSGWRHNTRYRFSVRVRVTDRNGETHEEAVDIPIGFINRYLDMNVAQADDSGVTLTASPRNLDGAPVAGRVKVEIFRLRQPKQPLLPLPVSNIERNVAEITMPLSPSEFSERYPLFDRDGKAGDMKNWPVDKRVLVRQADLPADQPLALDFNTLPAGAYKVVATLLSDDDDTMSVSDYVAYMPREARKVVDNSLLWCDFGRTNLQVGDTAHIRIGSRFHNQKVFSCVCNEFEVFSQAVYSIDDGVVCIDIPIIDNMRGGFDVNLASVLENTLSTQRQRYTVDYPHKKLTVSINTFRNKMEPGGAERWTLRVSDSHNGRPLPAALAMTMYDHSLDSYGSSLSFVSPWQPAGWRNCFPNSNSTSSFHGGIASATYPKIVKPCNLFWQLKSYMDDKYVLDYEVCKEKEVADGVLLAARSVGAKSPRAAKSNAAAFNLAVLEEVEVVADGAASPYGESAQGSTDNCEPATLRTNLSTLAFFAPNLRTGADGTTELTFMVPELLTEWSVRGFAWSADMAVGSFEGRTLTQKPIMVVPNVPRFLRHGDTCLFSVKVSNLTDTAQQLNVELTMTDAATGEELPIVLSAAVPADFSVKRQAADVSSTGLLLAPHASQEVIFTIAVPQGDVFVTNYRVMACSQQHSDGEQGPIPLLPSRQLVTESMSFYINGVGEKHYALEHLTSLDTTASDFTLRHHALVVDLTPNPIWMAVQSLPYVSQQQDPSNIYLANAIYTNSLSYDIVKNNPTIEALFEEWREAGNDAFVSELDRNADLKQTVIDETPWLRDVDSEQQRHRDIARFFDRASLQHQLSQDMTRLIDAQRHDGSWGWIAGSRYSSLYTTQYILRTFGLLQQLGIEVDAHTRHALNRAMDYVDRETYNDYVRYVKGRKFEPIELDYLYLRSLYPNNRLSKQQQEAYDFYYQNAKKHNESFSSLYCQSVLALVFHRHGDSQLARSMATRLLQKGLYSDEMGMYWRDNAGSYFWHERPIETQALMIRTIAEVLGDYEHVAQMQQWLLKQKQTTRWSSDVATVNAIQALLIQAPTPQNNNPSLAASPSISLTYGSHTLTTDTARHQLHIGDRLMADEITPADGQLTLRKADPGIAWGAMYWQYFEQVEKIPASSMGVSLGRKLYRVNADGSLTLLTGQGETVRTKVGDKIRVRIDIHCDRDMEYLELKEPRCAALEPVDTQSGWCWNRGLSFYRSLTNTAQTLYIDRLDKGDYYVEYDIYVNNGGTYTTAPTTLQCLYAPEFRALCPMPNIQALR